MHLNINDRRLIEDPQPQQVQDALRLLDPGEFAILVRDEDDYVQVMRDENEEIGEIWILEYRDGSEDRHFGTDPEATTLDDARRAFTAFHQGQDLASLLAWETIDASATEPGEGEVLYNGVVMDADWPAEIEAAQTIINIQLGGKSYKRVAFGKERDMATQGLDNCGECGVLPGQLHVPDCDLEQCPKCYEQLSSCGCQDDD